MGQPLNSRSHRSCGCLHGSAQGWAHKHSITDGWRAHGSQEKPLKRRRRCLQKLLWVNHAPMGSLTTTSTWVALVSGSHKKIKIKKNPLKWDVDVVGGMEVFDGKMSERALEGRVWSGWIRDAWNHQKMHSFKIGKQNLRAWRILAQCVQGSEIHPQSPHDSGYMRCVGFSGLMWLYVMWRVFWCNVVVLMYRTFWLNVSSTKTLLPFWRSFLSWEKSLNFLVPILSTMALCKNGH